MFLFQRINSGIRWLILFGTRRHRHRISQYGQIYLTSHFLWCNLHEIIIHFMMRTSNILIHWTPRILCILAILFVSLFALDSFSSERTFWQNTAAFLMHLIPSFVLIAILIVAWKREKVGGIILLIAGVGFWIFTFNINYNQRQFALLQSIINASIICLPFILAGVLFIISHFRRKKELSDVR